MCIPGEAFSVRHVPIPVEAHSYSREDMHSRWVTSPFPVRMSIPGEDVHSIVIYGGEGGDFYAKIIDFYMNFILQAQIQCFEY